MERPKKQILLRLRKRFSRGSVVVEAVFMLPFTIWLLFCVIQYGVVLNTATTITDIDREAARYASMHATVNTINSPQASPAAGSVQAYVQELCTSSSINYSDFVGADGHAGSGPIVYSVNDSGTYTLVPAGGTVAYGQGVAVKLQYPMYKRVWFSSLVPGMSNFTNTNNTWNKTTVMIVENPQ